MTTSNIAFAFFTLLTLTSCNSNDTQRNKTIDCKPYFQFDKVEHYFLNISENNVWAMQGKENNNKKEEELLDMLIQDLPDKLADTSVLRDIQKFGFVKKDIPTSRFGQLNEIFCERKRRDILASACIPIYRDVLIFKRANRTIGFAKICFQCDQSLIVGTNQITDEFGQYDYEELHKLLR